MTIGIKTNRNVVPLQVFNETAFCVILRQYTLWLESPFLPFVFLKNVLVAFMRKCEDF